MRALRNCDFCGDEAIGAFEVVPAELDPTDDEQRRVVLCGGCRDRLDELLEPLLARARTSPTPGSIADGAEPSDSADGDGGTLAASSPDDPNAVRDRTPSERARVTDADGFPESSADRPGGITFESDDSIAESDDAESQPSTDASAGADSADDGATDSAGSNEEGGESDSEVAEPASSQGDRSSPTPRAYGKVIRLLRNREFPMARDDVEALAAGAYELDEFETKKVVDRAIEEGELLEDGNTLRRP